MATCQDAVCPVDAFVLNIEPHLVVDYQEGVSSVDSSVLD
jgi:hypothetical protein